MAFDEQLECRGPDGGRPGLRCRTAGGSDVAQGIKGTRPTCSVPGCPKKALGRGYCGAHYQRWRRHGDPLASGSKSLRYPDNILLRQAPQPNGCIYYTGSLGRDGYGQARDAKGRNTTAHQLAWGIYVGPRTPGLVLDHICHNEDPTCPGGRDCIHRRCVNVDHMEETTNRENVRRGGGAAGINARKTHCNRGHEFNAENTRTRPDGARECRTCRRDFW